MRSKADISRGPARGNQVKKKKINQRTNFAPKYHNKDLFTGTGGKVAYNSTQVEENNVIRWIKFHEISFSSVLNVYAWTIYIKNQKYIESIESQYANPPTEQKKSAKCTEKKGGRGEGGGRFLLQISNSSELLKKQRTKYKRLDW